MTPKDKSLATKKILTIEGKGWKEVYEERDDGSRVLLYSNAGRKMDWNTATSMAIIEDMSWSEFCRLHKNNPQYKV